MSEFGFVYIWYDRKNKMYYIGSHWGLIDDGYICSSRWMLNAYKNRPEDFKRRIVAKVRTNRIDLLSEEQRWLDMIKPEEMIYHFTKKHQRNNIRYYNISKTAQNTWHYDPNQRKTIGQKISEKKTGKSTGPCSPEKAKTISEAKKRRFAERKMRTGSTGMPSTKGRATGWKQTEEWKITQSEKLRQQWSNGTRKHSGEDPFKDKTEEEKKAIVAKRSATLTGRKLTQEHTDKLCLNWIVTSPTGEEQQVRNLNEFCRQNNLTRANIARTGSKGWKARRVDIGDQNKAK